MSNQAVQDSRSPFDRSKYEKFVIAELADCYIARMAEISENVDVATFYFWSNYLEFLQRQGALNDTVRSRRSALKEIFNQLELEDLPFERCAEMQEKMVTVYSRYFSEVRNLCIDQRVTFYEEEIQPLIADLNRTDPQSLLGNLEFLYEKLFRFFTFSTEEKQGGLFDRQAVHHKNDIRYFQETLKFVQSSLNQLIRVNQELQEDFDVNDADKFLYTISKIVDLSLSNYRQDLFLSDAFIDHSVLDLSDYEASLLDDVAFDNEARVPTVEGRTPHLALELRSIIRKSEDMKKIEIIAEGSAWPIGFEFESEESPSKSYHIVFLKRVEFELRKFLEGYPSLKVKLENHEDVLVLNFDQSNLNIEKYQVGELICIANGISFSQLFMMSKESDLLDREFEIADVSSDEDLEKLGDRPDKDQSFEGDRDSQALISDTEYEPSLSAFVENQQKQVILVQLLGACHQGRIDNTIRTAMGYLGRLEAPQIDILDVEYPKIILSSYSPVRIISELPYDFPRRFPFLYASVSWQEFLTSELKLKSFFQQEEPIYESRVFLDSEILALEENLKTLYSLAVPISIELQDCELELWKFFFESFNGSYFDFKLEDVETIANYLDERTVYKELFQDLKNLHTNFVNHGLACVIKLLRELAPSNDNLAFALANQICTSGTNGLQVLMSCSFYSGTTKLNSNIITIYRIGEQTQVLID